MAEGGNEDREKSEYKDHYKRILVDLISRRNIAGFLENEEAVEGTASTSFLAGGSSRDDNAIELNQASQTQARCHSLASSLQRALADSADDGLAVFHTHASTAEPGNGTSCQADSENQLIDLPPASAAMESGSALTPEPSLMCLNERQASGSGADDCEGAGAQKKKKWRIFKGFKNPLAPK